MDLYSKGKRNRGQKNAWSWCRNILRHGALPAVIFALIGCGESTDEKDAQIDYALFDDAAVEAIFDAGDYNKVVEIVRGQEALDIDDKSDHLIAARAYTRLLNGIATEVSIEKAVAAGAEPKETVLLLARALLLQGKYKDAERTLEQAVLLEGDAYEGLLLRGDIHKESGNIAGARQYYEAAIADQPDAFRGYVGMALLELYEGNLEEAERLARLAEERSGADPIVYYVRGVTARYQQDIETAKSLLGQATKLHGSHLMAHLELAGIYVEEGDIEAAEKELDVVFAVSPKHSMAQYYAALILAAKGKDQQAEDVLLEISDLTRAFPPATRIYGHVSYRLGKFSTAQAYLRRFLALVPGDRATRLALAESLTRRGRANEALELLQPIVGDDSTDLEALLQAAAAAGLLGETLQARHFLEKAEGLATGSQANETLMKSVSHRLSLARFMTGEREQALSKLRAMYEKDQSDFVALTLLANMQMQDGNLVEAEATARRLSEMAPDNPMGVNLLGSIRHRQHKPEEAIVFYNNALTLNASYVSALKNRALSYLALGKHSEAATDLERVVAKASGDAQAHSMLGRAYLASGKAKEAVPHLQLAEDTFPTSAIIMVDLSQALATLGYMSSAVSKAQQAKQLAMGNEKLTTFISGLLEGYQAIIDEEKAEQAKEEEEKRRAREEERKAREAESADAAEEEPKKPEGDPVATSEPSTLRL